jgi:hypothetical protein
LVVAACAGAPVTVASAASACGSLQCAPSAELPYALTFSADRGGIGDAAGSGTGFSLVQALDGDATYRPDLMRLDTAAGLLRVTSSPGIAYRAINSLENGLGIGIDPRGGAFRLETTLAGVPAGSQGFEQGGLWLGLTQDDYVKLVAISAHGGTRVHLLWESAGKPVQSFYGPVLSAADAPLTLRLRVDPAGDQVTAAYEQRSRPARQLKSVVLPAGAIANALGADQRLAAGIFASQRRGPAALEYDFDDFAAACIASCTPGSPAPGDPDFGDGTPAVGQPYDPRTDRPIVAQSVAQTDAPTRVEIRVARRISRARLRRPGLAVEVRCTPACSDEVTLTPRALPQRRKPRALVRWRRSTMTPRADRIRLRVSAAGLRRLNARRDVLVLRVVVRSATGAQQVVKRLVVVHR